MPTAAERLTSPFDQLSRRARGAGAPLSQVPGARLTRVIPSRVMRVERVTSMTRVAWPLSLAGLVLSLTSTLPACKGDSEREGILAAQRAAEAEAKLQGATAAAPRMRAPVEDSRKVECTQLINLPMFREALGEKEPLSMRDTAKANADASAACSLMRGGRPLSAREQEALIKRAGKLGVLAGDELCHIAAFCGVRSDDEAVRKRCTGANRAHDDGPDGYACVTTVPHGAVDAISLRFVDPDTHCVFEVRGGPSMADNDFIRKCAKAARDLIGPDEIAARPPESAGGATAGDSAEPAATPPAQ